MGQQWITKKRYEEQMEIMKTICKNILKKGGLRRKDKEFMNQKMSDMSINELADAIKIKIKENSAESPSMED